MNDLKNIKYWLFDLDNTLYDGATKVFEQVDKKMTKFISEKLNVDKEEARKIQKNYFQEYNTTLNGMIKHHKIDADEFLTDELKKQISTKINHENHEISGISFNRKVRFFNKDINFGGVSPHKTLRLWQTDKGKCEEAWMDEQIIVSGIVSHINENLIDRAISQRMSFKE